MAKRGAKPKSIKEMLKGWDKWESDIINKYTEDYPTDAMFLVWLYQKTGYQIRSVNTYKRLLKDANKLNKNSTEYKFLTTVLFCKVIRQASLEELLQMMAKGELESYGMQALKLALMQFPEYKDENSTKVEVKNEKEGNTFTVKLKRPNE